MARRYTIIGEKPSRIELQTSRRKDVENSQGQRVSVTERREQERLQNKYDRATFRTDFHPEYNCHGLTFASKRTGIHNTDEIRKIIDDDTYEMVDREDCLPGDVVLYFGDDGDIEHSGVVLTVSEERLVMPCVLSKWGNGGEVVHRLPDSPYEPGNVRFYRRVWADKQDDDDANNG